LVGLLRGRVGIQGVQCPLIHAVAVINLGKPHPWQKRCSAHG